MRKSEIFGTEVWGFDHAIGGMRNPLNSWANSDSMFGSPELSDNGGIGEKDLALAQKLVLAGTEHSKFMRMIHVSAVFNMPRYWWSEADTYKFIEKNSCSTMHTLLNTDKEITMDLFSYCEEDADIAQAVVKRLEDIRVKYRSEKDNKEKTRLLVRAKRLLMEGFLQIRSIDTNYAELRNMYFQRRNHRLKEEWVHIFCTWVEGLPYAKELICLEKQDVKVES